MNIMRLSYLPSLNRFMDTDSGCIIHILQPYFKNWQLDEWKKKKQHGQLVDMFGNVWGIEYLSADEEDEALMFMDWQSEFGVRVVKDYYHSK